MLKNKLYVYGKGKLEVPAHLNVGQEILDSMITNKDKVALISAHTNKSITYGELAQQAVDVALSLARMGVGKGEVVSICSEMRFEVMFAVLGVIFAGATLSSADHTTGTRMVLHRLNISKPKVLFCSSTTYNTKIDDFRTVDSIKTYVVFGDEAQPGAILFKHFLTEHARVEDFQPVPVNGLNDILFIRFTSGTTGLPKGIAITHLSSAICFKNTLMDCVPGKTLCTREWCYTYGLMHTLTCLSLGFTVIFCPKYSIVDFLEAIQKYKIKYIQLTPPSVNEFVKSPMIQNYDVTSVEYFISASTTLKEDAIVAASKIFSGIIRVIQLYGVTEVGVICTNVRVPKGTKLDSVGVTFPGFIIKVVDLDTREPLGPNQNGEICIKSTSPTVISKYLGTDNPDPVDEEGFYKTGDLGYYDKDHCFYIVDRIKELLKFHGLSLAPAEYEAVLEQHPSVLEAGVVGVPHEYGQAPLAFVVLRPGATATKQELVDHVNRQVPARMCLDGGVRFVGSLPRGVLDKLDRRALKQMLVN